MFDKSDLLDATDKEILRILSYNGRISMKELGEKVHLTGQAVKNRVDRLEALQLIKHYTFSMNCPVYGYKIHALIRAQVKFGGRDGFINALKNSGCPVVHCYKITGANMFAADMYFKNIEEMQQVTAQLEKFAACEAEIILDEIELE